MSINTRLLPSPGKQDCQLRVTGKQTRGAKYQIQQVLNNPQTPSPNSVQCH